MGNLQVKEELKKLINKLPYIRWLVSELEKYKKNVWPEPGHFYSPIVSLENVRRREVLIFEKSANKLQEIDLNENRQFELLNNFLDYYTELPFESEKNNKHRYYYRNTLFSYFDAISLYFMMRFFKPKKIVEIGSGFTSSLMLDVNELFFDNKIDLTFIEPFPQRLKNLVKNNDRFNLYERFFSESNIDLSNTLNENDFLFIDSSHVVKCGSELNQLIFNILPSLKAGVKIHFHDIFYPFEYPKEWILKLKRSWNESYFLRAFLMNNNEFEIVLFNSFLELFHKDWLQKNMPLCLNHRGSSLWISKKQKI